MVVPPGLEPRTYCLKGSSSNHWAIGPKMVDHIGVEPITSWMQIRRSAKWANGPLLKEQRLLWNFNLKGQDKNGTPGGNRTPINCLEGGCPIRWTTGADVGRLSGQWPKSRLLFLFLSDQLWLWQRLRWSRRWQNWMVDLENFSMVGKMKIHVEKISRRLAS